jgi:hypothetical protein
MRRGSKPGGRVQQQPEGSVRQSQVVTTFGPGSMVDLLKDAALVGGLDFWSYDRAFAIPHIQEPRLRDKIAERFQKLGRELSPEFPFRAPPVGNDREATRFAGIQVLEFPMWFVCQNPACRALIHAVKARLDLKNGRRWHQCTNSGGDECVPVRFVMACKRGHVDEFSWMHFAHSRFPAGRCAAPSLKFEEGATGDFNEILVTCECGASEPLRHVQGMKLKCHGARPWLGPEGTEDCAEEEARLLVRTATNSYFPQVMSALTIPDPAGAIQEAIRGVWDVLKNVTKETLPVFRTIDKVRLSIDGYPDEAVLAAVVAMKENRPVSSGSIRGAEFELLASSKDEVAGDRPPPGEIFFARRAKLRGGMPQGVHQVVVVQKLREVVAQIGFTRLEPISADALGEFDIDVKTASLGLTSNWLPATEMRGEGVFLQLDEKAVQEWEARPAVIERARELAAGYQAWAPKTAPPFLGVRFYMLHSLSHLLMSAISLECGYAASALRERIYAQAPTTGVAPMAAILLSTGTSGTEGTLGGLVEQGRQIRSHLRRAYDMGRLCSNDPVCATHTPEKDHAERYLEGAACHGCLYLAECSCERFNRYLDRALVVPALGHERTLAFFESRP